MEFKTLKSQNHDSILGCLLPFEFKYFFVPFAPDLDPSWK